jgi:hypothetical protein
MWKNDLFQPEEALKVDSRSETIWKSLPQTRISDSLIQLHLRSPGNLVSLEVFNSFFHLKFSPPNIRLMVQNPILPQICEYEAAGLELGTENWVAVLR